MARTSVKRRKWIKLYPQECIDGSIRYQLESDERGVWYDLLSFCAICSNDGIIADRDKRPYPLSFIANRLNINLELLERTLRKCKEEGRITLDDGIITISNWKYYQSEYARQKPYRKDKQPVDEDFISALKSNPAYKEIDIDRELAKMDAWLLLPQARGRKKTKRFILNWLNKVDVPITEKRAWEE